MNLPRTSPTRSACAPFAVPDAESSHLILVRHGATEANLHEPPRLQGRSADVPLCALGRQQAQSAAAVLGQFPLARIVASPLARAAETARIIAEALPNGTVEIELRAELMECDVGRWEGLDWGTIARNDPELHRRFMEDPAANGYPEGESFAAVHRRAAPVLDALLAESAGSVCVAVSHNVVNRTYLASLLGVPLSRARTIRQDNCCINFVRRQSENTEVLSLNSVLHLMT